jgi:hypothetical protein
MDSWSIFAIGQLPERGWIRSLQLSSYPRQTLALRSGREAIQDRYTVSRSVPPPRGSTDSPEALLVTSLASNCLAARSLMNVFLRFERSGSRHCSNRGAGECALHELDALGETCCSVRLLGGRSRRVRNIGS